MSDKENITNNTERDDRTVIEDTSKNNPPKSKSFMETVREVNERERREEIEKEAKAAEMRAEKERAERDEYGKKLNEERIELMKLKSGIISEDDIEKVEEIQKVYTTKEKISNFFYHHKWHVIVGAFICILIGVFIYDMVSKVDPDVSVMIIATDEEFTYKTDAIAALLEQYCGDYNGDGKVSVRVSYLPAIVDEENWQAMYVAQADQTKLLAEFQSEDSIIVIADLETCEFTKINEGTLADLRFVYRDDENAMYLGYMLSGTSFAEDIEYPELADNLFIGFREPTAGVGVNEEKFKKNYDNAIDLWTNYLNGNVVNSVVEE